MILRKIFLQGCGNIGSKSLWPRYGYFEKIFRKVYEDFVYHFEYLNKKRAWNISINVAANLPKHFVKCLCPLSKPFTKYFRKVSETFPVIIVGIFPQHFSQSNGKCLWKVVEISVQKVPDQVTNISRNFA